MASDKEKNQGTEAGELRRQAEAELRAKTDRAPLPRTDEAILRLAHELEVHQIELEMQNAELRQSRDEAEKTLDRYTDLYDFAPVGYFTLDSAGGIRAVNLTATGLLGVERRRLIGKRFERFIANKDRPHFNDFIRQVFASPDKHSIELELGTGGASPLYVLMEAIAGPEQECHAAVIDISERKRTEEEIKRLNAIVIARAGELEDVNKELEAFNYTVAHDLRNPLNVISSYCQALMELCSDKLDEQCQRYIRETYNGTLRMNRLIEALLNFSRLTHVETHREMVDLSAMAHEVATELRLAEPERRVTFLISDRVNAYVDAALVRVVLNNLLSNAWKYTGTRDEGIIEFGTIVVDGRPAYFVRDNGAGFDMADSDKLFTPFHRLPGAEECRGFGIGLATVERIIRRHNGQVWAEGEPGNGACFFFTL